VADTAILEPLLCRLAILGAVAALSVTLLLLADRQVEPATVPRRLVRRVRWWSIHAPAVLAVGVALTLGSLVGLAVARA
jgi:hypothetical protein